MVLYEIHYFTATSRGDLPRMLLEVGEASYKNVFIDYADWPTVKDAKSFGKVPNLVIVDESDGSRKVPYPLSHPLVANH